MPLKTRGIVRKVALSVQFSIKGIEVFEITDTNNICCERIGKVLEECTEILSNTAVERKQVSSKEQKLFSMEPPNDIATIDIYPTKLDFSDEPLFLRENVVDGSYRDVRHYIDVQFRLLREDFIAPLRVGIQQYRRSLRTNDKNVCIDNIVIHEDARILHGTITSRRFGHMVKLSKGVKNFKRFMYGSLVLFTPDNFNTFFSATIINPVDEHLLIVELCNKPLQGDISEIYEKNYMMIESEIYFEPYYHVLKALQQINVNTFPMKKYIVDVQTDCKETSKCDKYPYNFNETQQKAFDAAMNHDFVAIQGPPGTGKTFLAKAIAQEILERTKMSRDDDYYYYYSRNGIPFLCLNDIGCDDYDDDDGDVDYYSKCTYSFNLLHIRKDLHEFFTHDRHCRNEPPILIICYTNHALDQFLEGLLPFTKKVVRLGGQSKNKEVLRFNLKEIRSNWVKSERMARKKCKCDECKDLKHKPNEHIAHLGYVKRITVEYLENLKLFEEVSNGGLLKMEEIEQYIYPKFKRFLRGGQYEAWLLQGMYDDIPLPDILSKTNRSEVQTSQLISELRELTTYRNELDMYDIKQSEVETKVDSKFTVTLNILQKQRQNLQIKLRTHKSKGGSEEISAVYETQIEELGKQYRYISHMLKLCSTDDEKRIIRELKKVSNIWSLSHQDRWMLYHSWVKHYINQLKFKMMVLEENLMENECIFREIQDELDIEILSSADIVGITTTGAARLRNMLEVVKPTTVIVEEAAEVLEAHIVASLTPSVKKLILIGDHKQLKPSPAVYKLAKKYKLDISLFERMVNNGLGCQVLGTQHRMRPEIVSLIVPSIYPDLANADSVYNRPDIRGLTSNVYFICHQHPEDEVPDSRSRSNTHEVQFLISLYQYFLNQHYRSSDITILATYAGQMTALEKERRRRNLQEVRITTVDNYQGEENEIVLLSLVRSNPEAHIGFLSAENRVCVALSRARNGLYIIGNMDNLTSSSTIWPQIKDQLEKMNAIGTALPLGCKNHPNNRSSVTNGNDFKGLPLSGCHVRCGVNLPCGHVCPEHCHTLDAGHEEEFRCSKPCERMSCEEHICKKKCGDFCGACSVSVEKILPCGHAVTMRCASDPLTSMCTVRVPVTLGCGHVQDKYCFMEESPTCSTLCGKLMKCGHVCRNICHGHTTSHKECSTYIAKKLACGHTKFIKCSTFWSMGILNMDCLELCEKILKCGHPCKNKCYETCSQCDVMVEKTLPCGHEQRVKCSESLTDIPCREPCQLKLSCGHSCLGTCSQPCSETNCEEIVKCEVEPGCGHGPVYLPCHLNKTGLTGNSDQLLQHCMAPCQAQMKCGHTCEGDCGSCLQGRVHVPCTRRCSRRLACGHRCKELCSWECPALCNQACLYSCPHKSCLRKCGQPCSPCKETCERRCRHQECSQPCSELCDCLPCQRPCPLYRSCGHPCAGYCGETCPSACPTCTPGAFQFPGYVVEPDHRYIVLEDCGHPIEETLLKSTFLMSSSILKSYIRNCPSCCKQITRSKRFKENIKDIYKNLSTSKEEKRLTLRKSMREIKVKIISFCQTRNTDLEKYGDAAFVILDHLKNSKSNYDTLEEAPFDTSETVFGIVTYVNGISVTDKNDEHVITERCKLLLKALSLRLISMSSWDRQQINLEFDHLKQLVSSSKAKSKQISSTKEAIKTVA